MMQFEFSAGGVVMRVDQVLLIRSIDLKGRSVWTFPKGKLNAGEKSPDAALREVQEETGWRCRSEAELPRSEYWFQREGQRVKKTVRWYRMTPIEQKGSHDDEIEEAIWISVTDAMARLTYPSDRKLLETAVKGMKAPEVESGP
jgi:diadenosine hexaphosphate hydrolase (ATP-forming)